MACPLNRAQLQKLRWLTDREPHLGPEGMSILSAFRDPFSMPTRSPKQTFRAEKIS